MVRANDSTAGAGDGWTCHPAGRFGYADACRVAEAIGGTGGGPGAVLLDLDAVTDATTAALARLIVLRRNLLRTGRDLHIRGLHGRARGIYEVHRLGPLLPREA